MLWGGFGNDWSRRQKKDGEPKTRFPGNGKPRKVHRTFKATCGPARRQVNAGKPDPSPGHSNFPKTPQLGRIKLNSKRFRT